MNHFILQLIDWQGFWDYLGFESLTVAPQRSFNGQNWNINWNWKVASYRCYLLLCGIFLERNKFLLFSTMFSEACHFNVAFPAHYLTGLEPVNRKAKHYYILCKSCIEKQLRQLVSPELNCYLSSAPYKGVKSTSMLGCLEYCGSLLTTSKCIRQVCT